MTNEALTEFDDDSIMSDMMMLMLVLVMVSSFTTIGQAVEPAASVAQYIESQSYSGRVDTRSLSGTPTMQWLNLIADPPYVGWISVTFTNKGPHSLFVGINDPDKLHEIGSDNTYSMNFTGARRRIEQIYYKTNQGEKATAEVAAMY